MASPARDAKLRHEQAGFTEVVERGRGWLRSRNSSTGRYALTTQVGNIGWHRGAGPFTEADEVDTALVASSRTGYDLEMTRADYTAHVRTLFNADDRSEQSRPLAAVLGGGQRAMIKLNTIILSIRAFSPLPWSVA
jgi:hypothetical protein